MAGYYQPLWPFADETEVREWQRRYRSGGHQPWHLDADQTALAFTQGYLGFKEVNLAVGSTIKGIHARVKVGYRSTESNRPLVVAVIHLVKFGTGPDTPWEVVGTDDDTFSLTTPKYGGTVASPVRVGGRITGVDESIRVQIRQLSSETPVGEFCCLPAGGENQPWSATVSFRAKPGQLLTIVASTGGHVADVERVTVTGAHPA